MSLTSVIVCSREPSKLTAVETMYRRMFGSGALEFIPVHNPVSLASGYNQGFSLSHGEAVIFSHDDVEIISADLGTTIEAGLNDYDLIGIAGTTRLVHPMWAAAGQPWIFGQLVHPTDETGLFSVEIFGAPRRVIGEIQAIDGVFMAGRRELFAKLAFDAEKYDGFHLYDVAYSHAAYQAGKRICVRNDIHLFHASKGNFQDPKWAVYARRFMETGGKNLPEHWIRKVRWAGALVRNWDEARQIMTPAYWENI